ncbi:MAG: Gfo/Idh/MocA family oxidoreductase [Firmicutes bacterium]|nr:Gfo/Idh/MocA family oxidoreductase [Bacillota bacterium]
MYKPKVAIIGCGNFGRLHSNTIKKLDNFEILAYADINRDAAEYCCKQYSAKYYCEDYRRVLDDKDIDAVFVCTTHDSHYTIGIDAIAAGKHVFMEKPLALTPAHCDSIKKAIEGTGLKFMVGHKMRFQPNIKKVKAEVKRPMIIVAQMMDNRWPDNIWPQDPVKGGGNVLSQGCHIFDLITYIAGDWPDTVYAEGGTLNHSNTTIIDNIVATVRFKNRVIASVAIGDAGCNKFTSKTMLQVFTGNGCINLSNALHKYSRYEGQDVVEEFELTGDYTDMTADPQGFYAEVKEFYQCIVDGKEPLVGVVEGSNAVKMVHAAFESIRTGCVQKMG